MTGIAQTTFTVGDLNYRVNNDGVSVTVTGHVNGQGATGELNIPETVSYEGNDYAVTVIGNCAFLTGGRTGKWQGFSAWRRRNDAHCFRQRCDTSYAGTKYSVP